MVGELVWVDGMTWLGTAWAVVCGMGEEMPLFVQDRRYNWRWIFDIHMDVCGASSYICMYVCMYVCSVVSCRVVS